MSEVRGVSEELWTLIESQLSIKGSRGSGQMRGGHQQPPSYYHHTILYSVCSDCVGGICSRRGMGHSTRFGHIYIYIARWCTKLIDRDAALM